jgi:integrase
LGTSRHAEPLTLAQLRQILDLLAEARPGHVGELVRRDQLLLAFGWAAALRPGELVALDVDDVTFTGDLDRGGGGMLVRVRRSKDRRGRSEHVAVACASRAAWCPVRLAERATCRPRSSALFVHFDRHGNSRGRLAANAVSRVVKAAVADVLRLDPTRYNGQSLRAGYVAEARRHGVPSHVIARHTRNHHARTLGVDDSTPRMPAETAFGTWW